MKNENIKIRYAECLEEIYFHINSIYNEVKTETQEEPLFWFRGHSKASYNLEPSLFRNADYKYNDSRTYSNNHLREEYRFQNFMARNYDNVDYRMPQFMIEWLEVMQHYFSKTRLMDWSESLTIALEFALESFITPVKDLEVKERNRTAEPIIWILQPARLNKKVYHSFINNDKKLIDDALYIVDEKKDISERIWKELKKDNSYHIYCDIDMEDDRNMNAMISLSSLEMIRNAYRGREMEALKKFEMNPFFFLLLRYYSDGLPVEWGQIPPLAIIHPYHSQRIKNQRGVFTVFPHYEPNKLMKVLNEKGNTKLSIGMEYMPECKSCLHAIQIMNPQRVADELRITGAKRGNLYPDMQIISQDLENVIRK